MTVVLGDEADARGFALAGLRAVHCRSGDEVVRALDEAMAAPGGRTSVVFVSERVYRLAPAAIDAVRDRMTPVVLVLPGAGEDAR